MTSDGGNWHWRTSSSTPTGAGSSASRTTRRRAAASAGDSGGRLVRRGRRPRSPRKRFAGREPVPRAQAVRVKRLQRFDRVGGGLDERSALADERVRAPVARVEGRTGHGEHLAALFRGAAGGDETAGARGGLDHRDPRRETRNDAVAARGNGAPWAVRRRAVRPPPRRSRRGAGREIRSPAGRRRRPRRRPRRRAPVFKEPRCAWVSMPRARPDTTVHPAAPSSAARPRAKRPPAADASRAPTTATALRPSSAGSPRTEISGGGSAMAASAPG